MAIAPEKQVKSAAFNVKLELPPEITSHVRTGERGPQHEASTPATLPLRVALCGVCSENESKYRCSRCELRYCSVACSTLHKATHPAIEDSPAVFEKKVTASTPAPSITRLSEPTPGTLAGAGCRNPFFVLETSPELQTLFRTFPRLRSQLRDIYSAALPPPDNDAELDRRNTSSHSSRDRGGGSTEGRSHTRTPWTRDVGIKEGVGALRRAKEEYGQDGEGVREYADLVLRTISGDGLDVAQIVQQEIVEENARIIAQLLHGEAR